MGAAARSSEQLLDPVGVAPPDRCADQSLVGIGDLHALQMGVLLEADLDGVDVGGRHLDRDIDDHVVEPQRLGVGRDGHAGRRLVVDDPADQQLRPAEVVGPDLVAAPVHHRLTEVGEIGLESVVGGRARPLGRRVGVESGHVTPSS